MLTHFLLSLYIFVINQFKIKIIIWGNQFIDSYDYFCQNHEKRWIPDDDSKSIQQEVMLISLQWIVAELI